MSSVLDAVLTPARPITFRPNAVILFVAGYVALVLCGQWLALNPGHRAAVLLAGGLYMAVLLSSEQRSWFKWALLVFVLETSIDVGIYHEGAGEALCDAAGHAAGAFAGAHLVRVWRGVPFQLSTLPDVLTFSAAVGFVGPITSFSVHAALLAAFGQAPPSADWLSYWTGDAAGTLVLAPLLLTLRQHAPAWRSVTGLKWLEAAVLFSVLIAVLHFIFSSQLPTVYLSLPLILWAASRLGMPGMSLVMLIYMLVIVRYSALGLGPYGASATGRELLAQSFLALASISAMCLTAIIHQYQQAQIALRRATDELEQRVAERTAALAASEGNLRESNALFAVARSAARMVIIDWDVVSDTLKFSDDPSWLRGPLPPGGKYPLLKDQVHPLDRVRFLETRQIALDTLQGRTMDYRIVRTDGIVLWVQSNQTVFAGPDGKAARLVSATLDISSRKQIESSMRESEQRVRALLDGIPDRALLKDAEGRFIAVNRALEQGFGLTAEKIIGKTIFDIRPPAVAQQVAADDRMVMAEGKLMRFERRSLLGDSWVEVTKAPIYGADGKATGIVGIWRDITPRKEAEQQALLDSEQRYRTLVNATSQAIWILDAEGQLKTIIKSITGDDTGRIKTRNWLDFIHEEDRQSAAAAMQTAIAARTPFEHEHRILDRDGGYRDVLSRTVPVFNTDESVREWIGTSIDVSGRKTAERALRGLNLTLRRLSGHREDVREEERARIAQNLHDGAGQSLNVVRLKLAAISIALAQKPEAGTPAGLLAEVQSIVDQVNQEIRSLEFELSPPVLRQLGLVPALGWLAEEMQRSYGLQVSVSDDGEEKPLDQTRRASVFRAVRELLINVAKHAKVNTAHVDAQRSVHDILLTVSDMGKGFDVGELEALEIGGLGLAGVRERTDFAGGNLRIRSAPGTGTVVTITMPLHEDVQ